MNNIVFFSPFSEISVHAVPEAELAHALEQERNNVTIVRCKGLFNDFCISMSARGLSVDSPEEIKNQICKSCISKGDILYKKYKLKTIFIDDFYKEDKKEIPKKFKKFSMYEFILDTKISSLTLSQKLKRQAQFYYKNAKKLYISSKKILTLLKPNFVITYNNYYGLNHIFSDLAKKITPNIYTIHGGTSIPERYTTLFLHKNYKNRFLWSQISEWKKYKSLALSSGQILKVSNHIKHLFNGKDFWVYSKADGKKTKKEVQSYFGLNPSLKNYVLLLSSPDEMFAAQTCNLFNFNENKNNNQLKWIKETVEIIKGCSNLNLIIRVHPRETKNKREAIISQNFLKLKKYLNKIQNEKIKINWPEDNISIQELARVADLCLNRTSTAGIEMILNGVPVLQYLNSLLSYPCELNIATKDKNDYKRKIELFSVQKIPKPDLIKTYRWLYFKNHRVCASLDEFKTKHFIKYLDKEVYKKSKLTKIRYLIKWLFGKVTESLKIPRINDTNYLVKAIIEKKEYFFKDEKAHNENQRREKNEINKSLQKIIFNGHDF